MSQPSAADPTGLYMPSARRAPFEVYYGAVPYALRELELLDESFSLKVKGAWLELPGLGGLYNLSFLVSILALLYLAVRNLRRR